MTRHIRTRTVASFLILAALAAAAGAADNAALSPSGTSASAVTWTLEQVAAIAVSHHPLVRQADAQTAAAAARRGQAESAWYPFIDLSTGVSRTRAFSVQAQRSATVRSEFLQADLSVVLTDFGRTRTDVNRAAALVSASREDGTSVREDVGYNAKVAYFNVLRAVRSLEVSRETLRQRESLLRQAQAFYEAGIRAKIDAIRAEASLYDARAQLTQAENNLRVARITLLNRMGIEGPADYILTDSLASEKIPGTIADWVAEAEKNRPELKSLREQERAAAYSVRYARGGYLPSLTGSAGYGYAAEDMPLQENYLLGVTLTYPLFSGFLTREQVREALASLASIRHGLTDSRRQVRLQVEQAGYGVGEAAERIVARTKERDASEENLRLATARYEVGVGDIIEMIDAQVQMTTADTAAIDAQYDYSVSLATLLRAMGR